MQIIRVLQANCIEVCTRDRRGYAGITLMTVLRLLKVMVLKPSYLLRRDRKNRLKERKREKDEREKEKRERKKDRTERNKE